MPPTDPVDPPEGDVVPYPNDILKLGGNRWLSQEGRIIPVPFGDEVDLEPNTLAYWESAALRGTGKPLSELIV
ncbi:hypothetical protein PBI_CHE12_3 [Mycobacterium phage Che12]|uniref:Uncharacterized protein n=1 Tax=Mycobacterium phage Che12 TaxID=2911435 RepID=Q1A0L1_9CAUD|nr:gp3 [Mycobacterium phage Che12]ABE67325.1 hypothetical protein PBI_CHE12_3 [Mycobacterium phage Che12]